MSSTHTQQHPAARNALKVTEALWTDKIVEYAKLQGWWCYHTHDSRHSESGFPDLVLIRPPRVVFAELKTDTEAPTPRQRRVLRMLADCRQEVFVWQPRHWDEVVKILARSQPDR